MNLIFAAMVLMSNPLQLPINIAVAEALQSQEQES